MATLADTIKANQGLLTRDAQGNLAEQNPEEVQKLAQKAGLSAPPITAAGTAAIGGTAKQQDMAGSLTQKQAALNIAQSPDQNLNDVMRRQQVRTQASQSERAEENKAQSLKQLGQVGDRVQDLINSKKQQLVAQNTPPAQQQVATAITDAAGKPLTSDQVTAITPSLQALQANPTDMNAMLAVNKALGYDITRQLSPAEIGNLYQNANASIAASGAQALGGTSTVQDLIGAGLPYTAQDLSGLLGVPQDQVAGMTVQQIRDHVNQLMANEFNKTQQLQQQAHSGELGSAERAFAQQEAREMSTTGVRASEADVQRLRDQLTRGDQVQFNGQSMPVEQMLSSDQISKTISDYLNAAPGSDVRTTLEKTEPQLAQFIQSNQTLLKDASDKMAASATQFQDLQHSNASAVGAILPENIVPSDIVSKLIPGYRELSATAIDPSQVPVLAAAQGLDDAGKQQYANSITNLTKQFPEATDQLKGLSADEVKQLGLQDPNGKWSQYVQQNQQFQDLNKLNNVDDLVAKLYNNKEDYKTDLSQNTVNQILGFGGSNPKLDIIDANHDGKVDSLDEIKSHIGLAQPTLKGVLAGSSGAKMPGDYGRVNKPAPFNWPADVQKEVDTKDPATIQAALQSSLGKAAADGGLTPAEISKAYEPGLAGRDSQGVKGDIVELQYLKDHASVPWGGSLQKLIDERKDRLTHEAEGGVFDDLGRDWSFVGGWRDTINQKLQKLNDDLKDPTYTNPEAGRLKSLMSQILTTNDRSQRDKAMIAFQDMLKKYKVGT